MPLTSFLKKHYNIFLLEYLSSDRLQLEFNAHFDMILHKERRRRDKGLQKFSGINCKQTYERKKLAVVELMGFRFASIDKQRYGRFCLRPTENK